MKLSDIKPGMRRIDVTGKVSKIADVRETKTGHRVASVVLVDDSGSVELTVWDADIDKIAVGKTVTVENGYADSYKGKLQFQSGKFGKLLVE